MGGKNSGSRPIPHEMKVLRGTVRPDRMKPRPQPRAGVIRCPAGTPEPIHRHFRRLVKELGPTGMLRPVDTDMLLQLATALHVMHTAGAQLATQSLTYADPAHAGREAKHPAFQIWRDASATVRSLSGHFGLSPSDRERLSAPGEGEPENELTRIIARATANVKGA